MKCVPLNPKACHLGISDLPADLIPPMVQRTGDSESSRGRCVGDEANDGFVVRKRLASPIGADEREKSMLHFVPLARARWKMTHRDWDANHIGQSLQLHFPETQPVAIAPATISRDQQALRPRV